jgi:hypothetical protein
LSGLGEVQSIVWVSATVSGKPAEASLEAITNAQRMRVRTKPRQPRLNIEWVDG